MFLGSGVCAFRGVKLIVCIVALVVYILRMIRGFDIKLRDGS